VILQDDDNDKVILYRSIFHAEFNAILRFLQGYCLRKFFKANMRYMLKQQSSSIKLPKLDQKISNFEEEMTRPSPISLLREAMAHVVQLILSYFSAQSQSLIGGLVCLQPFGANRIKEITTAPKRSRLQTTDLFFAQKFDWWDDSHTVSSTLRERGVVRK
jgi:hypothetical protein